MMDTNNKTENLLAVIKKIIFYNQENSYYIAALEDSSIICGQYFDAPLEKFEGIEILLTGKWVRHNKYGLQFAFVSLEVKEREIYFFLTRLIKGVTKKIAHEITLKYTENEICDILDNNPEKFMEFKGIKEKKLAQIVKSWKQFKHLRELGSFLGEFGVSSNFINKIYETFKNKDNLIEEIKNNPYLLTDIKGIGFKKADGIAMSLKIPEDSMFRITSCMNYTLKEFCDSNGNSSIKKEQLFSLLDEALSFENKDSLYENALISLISTNKIKETIKDSYSPSMFFLAETRIAKYFGHRTKYKNKTKIVENFDSYIKKQEKILGFTLSDEQKKGVELINNGENTILLIGYAGTGKSTSSKAILLLLEEIFSYNEIHCLALSGIASQRIYETTGYRSSTIQSLLTKIENSAEDSFDYKVILIDEASMINSVTFYKLFSKISFNTILIIVGDDGQLPAIGAGDILRDAIKYKLAPICKLTKIYRQNEKQAISIIANDIRKGKVPNYKNKFEDFSFVDVSIPNYYVQKSTLSNYEINKLREENNYKILDSILSIVRDYIKPMYEHIKNKEIQKFLTLFQVITPMKNGLLGVENLNRNLQSLINKTNTKGIQKKLYEYKLADKVIHIKNENMKALTMRDYKAGSTDFSQKRVFNGQLGMVIKIDHKKSTLLVLYPNDDMVVFYNFDTLDNLISLAYCLTIHKTQGMEYDTALIPMTFSHFIMHNTKLLYTAITRAKNMCFVVGEDDAFESACKKLEITNRQTVIDDIYKGKIIY